MASFESIFGIKKTQITKNCILVPFLNKKIKSSFGLQKISKGLLYSCASVKNVTIIHTGIGASRVGDAVLYLEETECQNIFLYGACGATQTPSQLRIGELISPASSLAAESFSQIVEGRLGSLKTYEPNKALLKKLLHASGGAAIKKVRCITFGSLKLEDQFLTFFEKNKIDSLDMECSSLFKAAQKTKKRAAALLFVTDIVKTKPFFASKTTEEQQSIDQAIKSGARLLLSFLET